MAERAGLRKIYQSAQADELLDLAHAARLSGRADIERASLLACRDRFRGEYAARAAYHLGITSSPRDAARWFETYIAEQPIRQRGPKTWRWAPSSFFARA